MNKFERESHDRLVVENKKLKRALVDIWLGGGSDELVGIRLDVSGVQVAGESFCGDNTRRSDRVLSGL